MRLASRLLIGAVTVFGLGLMAQPAKAAFTINLNTEFSGSGSGNLDAGTLVFTANGSNVDVQLTGGADLGNISDLYFNLKNIATITSSSFTNISGGYTTSNFAFGSNSHKADGDGFFDVRVSLGTGNSGIGAGEIFTFTILDTTLDDVKDISVGGPADKTGFYAAVHAQGLGTDGALSGWYTGDGDDDEDNGGGGSGDPVPAPAGLVLLATAVPVLLLRRVVRRNKNVA
jgi:hypothetical protein